MKHCPKCGTLHDDNVIICSKCFYNFENADDKNQLKDKLNSSNSTLLKGILIGVIAVLGIALILSLAYVIISSSYSSKLAPSDPIIEKDSLVAPQEPASQELELTPSEVSEAFDFSEEAQIDFNADPENAIYEDIYDILGQGCSFYCVCSRGKLKASSTLAPQGRMNYYVQNIHDLRYNTAWVEGHPDYGIDEWVEYTLPANNPPIEQIIIVNGYVRTKKSWTENSRVRTLELSVDGKKFATIHLSDLYASQTFDVGEIKPHNKPLVLRFTIKDVYPGTKYKDTAITEIYFNGSAH